MLPALRASCLAFSSPLGSKIGRRELFSHAAGFAVALGPAAAFAEGANSKATVEKARAIYGSRVVRLQGADAATILEEKNAITLLISGAYRSGVNGNPADKQMNKQLSAIEKNVLKAAKAGDSKGAQAGIKEIVSLAKLRELDGYDGNYSPKQRRVRGRTILTKSIVLVLACLDASLASLIGGRLITHTDLPPRVCCLRRRIRARLPPPRSSHRWARSRMRSTSRCPARSEGHRPALFTVGACTV